MLAAVSTRAGALNGRSVILGAGADGAVFLQTVKARSLFGFYTFCLHVALPKRYFGSCNGMIRYCSEIGL